MNMTKLQRPVNSLFSVLYGARKPTLAVKNGMKASTSFMLRFFLDLVSLIFLFLIKGKSSSYSFSYFELSSRCHYSWSVRKFCKLFISQSRICKIGSQSVLVKHTKQMIVYSRESNLKRIFLPSSES